MCRLGLDALRRHLWVEPHRLFQPYSRYLVALRYDKCVHNSIGVLFMISVANLMYSLINFLMCTGAENPI